MISEMFRFEGRRPRRNRSTSMDIQWLMNENGALVDYRNFHKIITEGFLTATSRRDYWKFLFNYYPFNSNTNDRTEIEKHYAKEYRRLESEVQNIIRKEKILQSAIEDEEYKDDSQEKDTSFESDLYHELDLAQFSNDLSTISKDLRRTKNITDENEIAILKRILIVQSAINSKLGYIQGMNDIAALFIKVMNEEVDAFWNFHRFMELLGKECFMMDRMKQKIRLAKRLAKREIPNLYSRLVKAKENDMLFTYRWLLVWFIREFESIEEACRCFETIVCQNLRHRYKEIINMQRDSGYSSKDDEICEAKVQTQRRYGYEIFLCVAITEFLTKKCEKDEDLEDVLYNKKTQFDTKAILTRAKELFTNRKERHQKANNLSAARTVMFVKT